WACSRPCFFFSSRRRHTRWPRDWSSDVCSSDLLELKVNVRAVPGNRAHVDLQFEAGGAHDVFEKLPQRLGGGLAVELSVSNEFRGHKSFYLQWRARQ